MELKDVNKKNFRYGNIINYQKGDGILQGKIYCINYTTLTVGDSSTRHTIKYNRIIPILLSEEWFTKFKFENIQDGWFAKDKVGQYYDFTWNIYDKELRYRGNVIPHIDYVHQLQNFYFVTKDAELWES